MQFYLKTIWFCIQDQSINAHLKFLKGGNLFLKKKRISLASFKINPTRRTTSW